MGELDTATITKAYARWAPVYDLVFGAVFEKGRKSSIEAAERIGGRVLEVGVGTGISLPDYRRSTKLVGIDISEPMLRKAQERVRAQNLTNVETLSVMDAKNLAFPDGAFDAVVAQYVITAVPDPEATLDDFMRVLKPGGVYGIVDHSAAAGHGESDVESLHRIEESTLRADVEKAGFVLEGSADFLKRPDDTRDWSASPRTAGEKRGTSDRFVLKFVKPAAAK